MKRIFIFCLVIVLSLGIAAPALAAADPGMDSAVEAPAVDDAAAGELTAYETELLTVLGNIWGILIFFVVVVLCYFTYKFFRIFF